MDNVTMAKIERFLKDRNEALFSYDERKIRAYMRKYGLRVPTNDTVFWGSVNKAICNITTAPPELVAKAEKWLTDHGMSKEIVCITRSS